MREDEAFSQRLQFQRHDKVSHQFHGRGISVLAKVVNRLSQVFQDRFHFFKDGLVARGHNPKLGIRGFLFAAKDRRIEKIDTVLCVSFLFSQTRRRKDRAHVDRDLAFLKST